MDIKNLLKSAAPMLGAAIGGPFGGMAMKMLAEALGAPEAKPEDLPGLMASASPDQIAAIKKVDNDFKLRMTELGFANEQKLASLAVEDRQGARDMQTATQSKVPPTLAVMIVLCWAVVQGFLFTNIIDPSSTNHSTPTSPSTNHQPSNTNDTSPAQPHTNHNTDSMNGDVLATKELHSNDCEGEEKDEEEEEVWKHAVDGLAHECQLVPHERGETGEFKHA